MQNSYGTPSPAVVNIPVKIPICALWSESYHQNPISCCRSHIETLRKISRKNASTTSRLDLLTDEHTKAKQLPRRRQLEGTRKALNSDKGNAVNTGDYRPRSLADR